MVAVQDRAAHRTGAPLAVGQCLQRRRRRPRPGPAVDAHGASCRRRPTASSDAAAAGRAAVRHPGAAPAR